MSPKVFALLCLMAVGAAVTYTMKTKPAAPVATTPQPGDEVLEGWTGADVAREIIVAGRGRRQDAIASFMGCWIPAEGWTGRVENVTDILGGPTVIVVEDGKASPASFTMAGLLAHPKLGLPEAGSKITIWGRVKTYVLTPAGPRLDLEAVTWKPAK